MKIAFLLESFDLLRGGAEIATLDMAQALAALGEEIGIFAPADRCSAPSTVDKGISIHPILIPRRSWRLGLRSQRAWDLACALPAAAETQNFTTRIACGKILNCEFYWPHGGVHRAAREAALQAGRSATMATLAALARKLRPTEAVFDRIEDSVFENARKGIGQPIAISRFVQADMLRIHNYENAPIGHNGAPLQRSQSQLPRQQLRAQLAKEWNLDPTHEKWLLFVATNPRLKGAQRLRSARPFLPDSVRILWVGSPKLKIDDPRERNLGLRNDVPNLLAAADALVLPTHYDPCSLITLEAATNNCPIITTKQNGALDLLNDAALVLNETQLSGPSLASAITNLLQSTNQLRSLQNQALQAAKNHSPQSAAIKLLQIIQ